MKIAVWHNLNSGGGKRALYDHIKGLVERGHQVISFCPDTVDQSYLPISQIAEERIFPIKDKIAKRTSRFSKLNSTNLIDEKLKAELEHCEECAVEINNGNFDVLFANSSTVSYMSHIGRFVNIPKFIYLGEPNRRLYESNPSSVWRAPVNKHSDILKYTYHRLKHLQRVFWYSYQAAEEYNSACAYDMILVNSLFSRESVKRAYNLEAKVCYLGIDTEKFSPTGEQKEPFVLGFGSITTEKGIELCIEAIAIIEEKYRPMLRWIGNFQADNYAYKLIQLAEQKNVKIQFSTAITDKEVVSLLSRASVMVYFPHLEPFGLAPLEANACGTGVIGIKEGGIRETIVDGVNGFTISELNFEQIATQITKFTSDLNFSREFGMKSRIHVVNNWNLQLGADNIETRIIDLLKKNKNE